MKVRIFNQLRLVSKNINFTLCSTKGFDGKYGQGAPGGQNSQDGQKITVDFTITSRSMNILGGTHRIYTSEIKRYNQMTSYNKRDDGESNYTDSAFEPMRNDFKQTSTIIDDYKKFARKSMAVSHDRDILVTFLEQIPQTADSKAHHEVINYHNYVASRISFFLCRKM